MHDVVLMAVSAAVKTDIASWITDFQKSLFFITLFFCFYILLFMFFSFVLTQKKEPKEKVKG